MSVKVMVNSGKELKQDLSGKLRTIRVGVFKMHAHAYVSTHIVFFLILFFLSHTRANTYSFLTILFLCLIIFFALNISLVAVN